MSGEMHGAHRPGKWLGWARPFATSRPYVVLAVSLLLTVATASYIAISARERDRLRFAGLVQKMEADIAGRMDTYIALLRAGAGLFETEGEITRENFGAFVRQIDLARRYPGVQGIGFTRRVAAEAQAQFVDAVRRRGDPAFHIWPEGERAEYHTIVHLEPLDRRNRAAIGYDMSTEPTRRAAMERARDSGGPAASGKVTLVQEVDPQKQAGFLIYMPVYRQGARPDTVDERRAALEGFVYSPFRAGDLMHHALATASTPEVGVRVFAGTAGTPGELLYASNPGREAGSASPSFTADRTIEIAGSPWRLEFATLPPFAAGSGRSHVPVVVLVGGAIAAVLFGVTRAELSARVRAENTAAALRESEAGWRESEERTRLTLAQALDAVISIDAEGRIISWYPQAEQLFGWSEADALGQRLSELIIPPAYREAHERGLVRFRATGEGPVLNRRIELTALRRDGTEFPVELAVTSVRMRGATVFSAFVRDITAPRAAAAALRERETTFRLLFSHNPLPMWVYDLQTRYFLEVNTTAIDRYGYAREEFLRMRINDIETAAEADPRADPGARLSADGPGTAEAADTRRHRLKDGRFMDVEIVSHAMDFAGRRAALVVAIDVTELRRAQVSLWRYAERLRILHEIDRALIGAADPGAIAEAALRRLRDLLGVPRAIVNLFDLAAGEVEWLAAAGRRRIRVGPGVRFPLSLMGDVDALRRGEVQVVDVDALPRTPDAEALLASGVHMYMVVPMIAGGELIGGLSFGGPHGQFPPEQVSIAREVATQLAIAIAQARLHERVKRQAEELEERVQERTRELTAANEQLEQEIGERRRAEAEAGRANQAKSEFLSRMSHELRTPLNGILGFGQLLEMEPLPGEQRDNVDQILRAGRHLLGLINEVLDISRIEAGRLRLSLEPVPVRETVREAIGLVQPSTVERRVTMRMGAIDPHVHVLADRQRLQQILLNLLSNGVKYNRPGGAVMLSCHEVPGNRLRINVADGGQGITADKLARLFTPFDRLGAEATGVEGTGLGLTLSKHLVEAMGGTMHVQTEVGVGSTFSVELLLAAAPTVPDDLAPEGPGAEADASRPRVTVLYIEDNLSNLRLVERIMERRPWMTLLSAMQGRVGLELARDHRPDLILLDRHLPDVSGDEVLRILREDPRTSDVPVVILSADASPGQIQRLLEAGARAYLTKPIDVRRLLTVMDESVPHED